MTMLRAIPAQPTPTWPRRDDPSPIGNFMGQLRTANKRAIRAFHAQQARKALAKAALPTPPEARETAA